MLAAPSAQALPSAITGGLLLSVVSADHIVVAVGERGRILRSADDGDHWVLIQAPTQATLTRVIMAPGGAMFAVGFDSTILRSDDAGLHWSLLLNDDRRDNPLFGIAANEAGNALAVGGFGRAYASPDGRGWQATTIDGASGDPHLNALVPVSDKSWLLVGEQALTLVTDNAGARWRKLAPPVQGSLFGAVVVNPQRWLIFGLRGHLLATDDAGANWRAVASGTTAELLGGAALPDGRVLLVGSRGTEVIVAADFSAAHLLPQVVRTSYADCAATANGRVVLVGEDGVHTLELPPPDTAP